MHKGPGTRTPRTIAEEKNDSGSFDSEANDVGPVGYAPAAGRPGTKPAGCVPGPTLRPAAPVDNSGFSLGGYAPGASSEPDMSDAGCNVDPSAADLTPAAALPAGPQQTPFKLGPR